MPSGGPLLAGTDAGLFDVSGPTPRQAVAGRPVTAVVPSDEDARWWALVDGRQLVEGSPRSGWREAADLTPLALVGHCLLAAGDTVLVGTSEARLLRWDGTSLSPVAGFDDVPGRGDWYTPWGDPADVRSLAGDPTRPIVNVHVGGVWSSDDSGATWTQLVDVESDTHQVIGGGPDDDVLAAAAVGVGHSGDRGHTWDWTTDGLHAGYCRAVARVAGAVLVSASTGPGTRKAALYRRPDGAHAFERCTTGLPEWFDANVDTYCLAASHLDAAVGTVGGEVYRSADGGRTWSLAAEGLPPVRCLTW